jgi:hypothetical protein
LSATASRRTGRAVPTIPMVGLPLEMEPMVESKVRLDEALMERQRLGVSGRTLGTEMTPCKVVRLAKLVSFPGTTGRLPEWDGLLNRTLPSAED